MKPDDLRERLHPLIESADLQALDDFLAAHRAALGAVLDAGGADGDPLHHLPPPLVQAAAAARHADAMVMRLLAAGAPLERPDGSGATALYHAFDRRNFVAAQRLLDAGASPHAANKNRVRVFDKVLAGGDWDFIRRFLEQGHRLDHVTDGGNTCLHFAARADDVALYDLVRERTGVEPDQATRQGHRPADLTGSLELLRHMRAHCPRMAWDVAFENGDHSLHAYARRGASAIVRELLAHGVDPNLPGQHRNSPLHSAVGSGDAATVLCLLDGKAKVNARNKNNYRPLHWAAKAGALDIVRLLIERKADLNPKTNVHFIIRESHTPLYLALQAGQRDVARLLVERGADVNALVDTSQRTALHEAVHGDDLEMAAFLLDHGAAPNGIAGDGSWRYYCFPLQAARSGAMVDLLVARGADVSARNQNGESALHGVVSRLDACPEALRAGCRDAIAALLRHGADPSASPNLGIGALARCKDRQASAMLAAAIQQQGPTAPPQPRTAQQDEGREAYRSAIEAMAGVPPRAGPEDEVEELAEALFLRCKDDMDDQSELDALADLLARSGRAGADYVSTDSYFDRESSLHRVLYATRRSSYDDEARPPVRAWLPLLRQWLDLGSGALNHIGGTWRETPLHTVLRAAMYSDRNGDAEVQADYRALVELLLDRGADPNLGNEYGVHALDLAQDPAMAQLLRERGARLGAFPLALFSAIEYGDEAAFARALACDPPLDAVCTDRHATPRECTALLYAAQCNRLPMLQALLERGAASSARAQYGAGLLHMAAWFGAVESLRWLVERQRVDIDDADAEGSPPLHYLLASHPDQRAGIDDKTHRARVRDCARWLVERGAAVDRVDRSGADLASLVPKSLHAELLRLAARRGGGKSKRKETA